jgi:hypothetical protein
MHLRTLTPILVLCAWLGPLAAEAEPVRVTGGTFHMVGLDGEMHLTGEQGFVLEARVSASLGVWSPFMDGCYSPGCGGGPRSLYAHWSGGDLRGFAGLDDSPYGGRIGSASGANGWVDFAAELHLPEPGPLAVTLLAPFTFSGHLLAEPHLLLPALPLVGGGWATVFLAPAVYDDVPLWSIREVRFDFTPDPIPEPSTLLLVGGAGVALAARRVRRRL